MMLPFTRQQFFEVFGAYNAEFWPAAVVAYLLALAALVFAWRGTRQAGRIVAAVLAIMWSWVGVVYLGQFFSAINPVSQFFSIAFIVQAGFFTWYVWRPRGLEYGAATRFRKVIGGFIVAYALVLYPLIGLAVGERYPTMPLFGISPCPLLVFTFGLMFLARSAPWWLWIVPLAWAVVGGSAAVLLAVYQDWALPVAAAAVMVVLWSDLRAARRASQD